MIELLFSQYKDYSNLFIFLELTAVVFGIISVLFARKNNILVYPTGLVSTLIFVYILLVLPIKKKSSTTSYARYGLISRFHSTTDGVF